MKSLAFILIALVMVTSPALSEDRIEFLNGSDLKGTVIAIHKPEREVEFEATIAGKSQVTRYPYAKIHAVTWKGKRYEVTKKPAGSEPFVADPDERRSEAEVMKVIETYGKPDPSWLASASLDFPDTLDLSWPEPAPKPWNNRKNIGQHIWDVVNPNESRWRGGITLMRHLLDQKPDAKLKLRVQKSLASMYFRFFQDYPRAAYWWHEAGAEAGDQDSVGLAECYWRMGNLSMAKKMLQSRTLRLGKIKLLGDMGETSEALKLAESYGSRVKEPHECYLIAGDVARQAGKFSQALSYYQKVIDLPQMKNGGYDNRHRGRAQASLESLKQFELLDVKQIPNGAYAGSSLGYEGPVDIEVSVDAGRITDVQVTKHKEKQFYSAIADTTRQIVEKQNLKDVDTTSRATITSAAIINATAKALEGAQP